MAKPGRRAQPSKLKLLKGNPGRRPISEDEPRPLIPSCIPEPPIWLEAYAKDEWSVVGPELYRMGLLTVVDLTAFAAYCQSYARWRLAEEHMSENGNTVVEETGLERRVPQAIISQAALVDMNRFGSAFGLTPSARTSIHAAPPARTENKFKKLG